MSKEVFYYVLVKDILDNCGGLFNILGFIYCMICLRIIFFDQDKMDIEVLKWFDGVIGVVEVEMLQIIFGVGVVNYVVDVFVNFMLFGKNIDLKEVVL